MRVYVNNMDRPALQIPRLEGNIKEGQIAFTDQVLISNLTIKPDVT